MSVGVTDSPWRSVFRPAGSHLQPRGQTRTQTTMCKQNKPLGKPQTVPACTGGFFLCVFFYNADWIVNLKIPSGSISTLYFHADLSMLMSSESADGILQAFLYSWLTGFIGNSSLTYGNFATEREVTHGSYEVFPFTSGAQESHIKVDERMLYFWPYTHRLCEWTLMCVVTVFPDTFVLSLLPVWRNQCDTVFNSKK